MLEDLQCIPKHELLTHDSRGVNLHPIERQLLFFLC